MEQQILLSYALALVMNKNNEVLLEYRGNTDIFAQQYGLVGGKIEGKESGTQALARELKEEIGIEVVESGIKFAHVMHFMGEGTPCVAFFYYVHNWKGTISNVESNKHDYLQWFSVNKLPFNMIPRHRKAIEYSTQQIYYSEDNWK